MVAEHHDQRLVGVVIEVGGADAIEPFRATVRLRSVMRFGLGRRECGTDDPER
jgi:hypothetical protein